MQNSCFSYFVNCDKNAMMCADEILNIGIVGKSFPLIKKMRFTAFWTHFLYFICRPTIKKLMHSVKKSVVAIFQCIFA